MQRSSRYYDLAFIVECKPPGRGFFEQIAAFNSDTIAKKYADDCYKAKFYLYGRSEYRVMQRKGSGKYVCIHNTEVIAP